MPGGYSTAVGHDHLGFRSPDLEIRDEPPHVILVVAGGQREGDGQIIQGVGCLPQGLAVEMSFIHAKRPAENDRVSIDDARHSRDVPLVVDLSGPAD
ncbi:hypothetical protein V5E97_34880 [Singulisphaera sp. Ch08]|uniref:Uncharacterized protein n=1 Tax=Singulisphaera sp. Ch08 TaxID=3120278 RepID=A0AAU7CEV5_9BACT